MYMGEDIIYIYFLLYALYIIIDSFPKSDVVKIFFPFIISHRLVDVSSLKKYAACWVDELNKNSLGVQILAPALLQVYPSEQNSPPSQTPQSSTTAQPPKSP